MLAVSPLQSYCIQSILRFTKRHQRTITTAAEGRRIGDHCSSHAYFVPSGHLMKDEARTEGEGSTSETMTGGWW